MLPRNHPRLSRPMLDTSAVITQGGGGTLVFSYIRRLGSFFGFKSLNFNIFLGFQKNEYFWGYVDFVDIFWGHHDIRLLYI